MILPRPPRFEKILGLTEHFLRIQQEIEQWSRRVLRNDADIDIRNDVNIQGDLTVEGTGQLDGDVTVGGDLFLDVTSGITASTTQSQGQQPLTTTVNIVNTVANTGDVVTLPAAAAGKLCLIRNAGNNNMTVYAASGDNVNGASTQTVNTGYGLVLVAEDDTDWWTFSRPVP